MTPKSPKGQGCSLLVFSLLLGLIRSRRDQNITALPLGPGSRATLGFLDFKPRSKFDKYFISIQNVSRNEIDTDEE